MVMETPSPQCVGREFVRQYYTLLHEAPGYLHRFYSHNSSFVHGGVEKPGEEHPPVMGQADIHKKIVSLNFHDCHAKIRQVDSQATVGNAVVVQVTGELSNNGQPMRRFMQTFVLAPQTPKKYYVHNDIFRYQDEVFHDTDTEGENQEEPIDAELEMPEDSTAAENVQDPTVTSYYEAEPAPISNGSAHLVEERAEEPQPVEEPEEPLEPSAPDMEAEAQEEEEAEVVEPAQPAVSPVAPSAAQQPAPVETVDEGFESKQQEKTPEPEQQQPTEQQPEVPKSFSWADIIASKTGSNPAPMPAPTASSVPPAQLGAPQGAPGLGVKPQQVPVGPASMGGGKPDHRPAEPGGGGPQPQRAPRPPRVDRTKERDNSRPGMEAGDDSRRSRYPDSQQLFVGNLPHTISEKELKQFFENYGVVLEVRINRKSTRDVPNFGFVVFDNSDSVQKVLEARPLMIRNEHRLNVEEKKQRGEQGGRPGSGTRTGGRGPGGPGMGRGGGPPGGMGRPSGPRGGGGPGGPPTDRRPDNRVNMSGGGGGGRGGFGPRRS